jgi:16S rRNA (adenine1518-N6/adenine1519-N6)-dimethyltransferase
VIPVIPKKSLGQHFLTDKNIARKIVNSLTWNNYSRVLEIGPGKGILTALLVEQPDKDLRFVEIDASAVAFLQNNFPQLQQSLISADILVIPLTDIYQDPFAIIGNFPYNISSQLFFKILENRHLVVETVCMIQKEVAVRIASPPGSREYGILSVLLQSFYHIEYLFSVPPQVFTPPPRVNSAVIRLTRNSTVNLPCSETLFTQVVKTAFNQRRKTLRNSLKSLAATIDPGNGLWQKRPEQLGVEEFINLTLWVETSRTDACRRC